MGDSQRSLPPPAFNNSDLNVPRTGMTVLGKIDESGPSSQPLPEEVELKDINLDDLWEHISELWKLRGKGDHEKASRLCPYTWPKVPGLQNLKLRAFLGGYYYDVEALLTSVNVVIVAPLVVAHTLERLDIGITNRDEEWDLTKIMYDLAILLKKLSERPRPKGMQHVMQEATSLIVEGACVLSLKYVFRSASEVSEIRRKLDAMYVRIIFKFSARVFSRIPHPWRSRLLEKCSIHAEKVKDVNLDDLWVHIFMLWKLREKGNHEEARSLGPFTWPHVPGLHKLKEFVSIGTDLAIEEIYGTVKAILEEIGREIAATAAPLVVAHTWERLDYPYTHKRMFCHLVEEMYELAIVLNRFSKIPEETQDVMQQATALIVEGARVFCGRRRSASEVRAIRHKLKTMKRYIKTELDLKTSERYINTEFTDRVLPRIKHQLRSHHSKEYPAHADNGQVEEDLLLTGQVEEDLLVPEPQKVYINTGQVEEDLPVPEPQKAYIHNNEPVEEDLLVPEPQKVYIDTEQVEEDLLVPEPQKAYIHNNEQVEENLQSAGRQKGFKMKALEVATNNFHEKNKVGQGGFGAVYKGTTHDGKQIAVKKMSFTSDERSLELMKKQFENEKLLAELRHRNLVNLLGYCEQGSERFLVYEYLPNESLDKFLSDPKKRKALDWPIRNKIFLGTACGLRYLHEDCGDQIVHRDIKASNILLDEKLNPKIADFGTAKHFPEDRTHVTATSGAVGTFGYKAPEYAMEGQITVKTDVYSFGVVLLELLTGKLILNNGTQYLEWVWSSYKQNKVADTIDRTITETWDKEKGKAKALRCFQVALLCIQNDAKLRPTMSRVITMLSSSDSLPVPRKPPLVSSPKRSVFDSMLQRRGGK